MQHPRDTAPAPRRLGSLDSLQCARGVAALLVVYFHASSIANSALVPSAPEGAWYQRLSNITATHLPIFGKCGVDLFFVISGYIIWMSTRPQTTTLMFYKKRIARVVPLYWLTTVLIACALFFAPRAFNTLRLDESHVLASLFFIPWPNPAFSPGASGEFTPLLVAGWTLNFEMMFYLLFGLAIAGAASRLWAIISTFAIFTILIMLGARWIPNLHFYDPFLIAEFLLGCGLAALGNKLQCSKATLMALLITAFAALLVLDALDPPTSRFFSMGIPAFIVLFALIQLERVGWWLASKPFTSVGNASYSIYLTHIFALAIARHAWHPFASHLLSKTCQIAFCSTVILFAIAIGLLCFKFVEKPLVSVMEQALGIRRRGGSALLPETLARSNSSLALKIP